MSDVRLARCDNLIGSPDLTVKACPGRLRFRREDGDAPCDICGARCGALVADYIGEDGPWSEAEADFLAEVSAAWTTDHEAGHPKGRANCPLCATTDSQTDAGRQS